MQDDRDPDPPTRPMRGNARPGSRGSFAEYGTDPRALPAGPPPNEYGDWGRPYDSNTAIRASERPGATRGSGTDLRERSSGLSGVSHAGRGPKSAGRSDERLHELICDRLSDDRRLDASEIEVRVEEGEVTLSGHVASRVEKRQAELCAESVRGIAHVQNDLRVEPDLGRPGPAAIS